jgi:hypothetical protein
VKTTRASNKLVPRIAGSLADSGEVHSMVVPFGNSAYACHFLLAKAQYEPLNKLFTASTNESSRTL